MNQLPESDTRPVAFFDFDGTLTTGDTLMPFLKYVVGTPTYYAKLALVSPVLAAYFAKLLRNDIAKQIVLKQYLAGYHIDELFELGQRFSDEVIPDMLRPEGMERLRWHQDQGHECVLVSASMDVYLNAWARRENFLSVICTSLNFDDEGFFQGKITGKNCYGDEKVERIKKIAYLSGKKNTYAYGDTAGDIEMLKFAEKGFLLNIKKNRFENV
nr:HAD-IB family hydrolase [uncultured Halomonas sp.]